jgi:GDP-4-dehydro-6-deoxy-D-mannose reductase
MMEQPATKKVLITGCSGFLGPHLIDLLAKNDNLELSGITEVDGYRCPGVTVYRTDIGEKAKVFEAIDAIRPDLVFHLAAIANVGFSWRHQELTYKVNFLGASNLLDAVHEYSPHARIILMSSAELYGDCQGKPCTETTPLAQPGNPYSLSKRAMEMAGQIYLNARKMDIITVRAFNFTGPGQSKQFVASDFARQIARIEKGDRQPIIEVGNLSAVRDFSDVRDIARYLTVIAEQGKRGGIYNLCSSKTYSIEKLLDILRDLSTQTIEVVQDKARLRPVDIPKLWGDNSLIKEKFNLRPQYEIRQTLSDLLNYWREQN